jgi:hypothetical protein
MAFSGAPNSSAGLFVESLAKDLWKIKKIFCLPATIASF